MHNTSTDIIKQSLFSNIQSLFERKDEFLINPQTDFSRIKKISFEQTILFPMIAGSEDVSTELMDFFPENKLPFPSAMIQRRNQVKPEAFLELFHQFTQEIPVKNLFYGHQLAAVDGSRLNLPYNPSDPDTFIQCITGRRGINQIHMNALYDPLNDIFLDVTLQGISSMNEKAAFCGFLDKNSQLDSMTKRIYLADRGYASYNIFAHAIHNNQMFLIRVPESFAKSICTVREHWLEESSCDEKVLVHIGRRMTKENRKLENYHNIPSSGHYDFIAPGTSDIDCLPLRVLKFPIADDSFEYIVTNLPTDRFSLETVKKLYHLRWNEETAFRHLKYAGNMVHLHSLKKDLLLQEIYGKLTLYNFSSALILAVQTPQKKTEKYIYVIDHTQAQKSCIRFLRGLIQDIDAIIIRFWVPIRLNRKFPRNIRRQSAVPLNNR